MAGFVLNLVSCFALGRTRLALRDIAEKTIRRTRHPMIVPRLCNESSLRPRHGKPKLGMKAQLLGDRAEPIAPKRSLSDRV